MKYNLTNIMNTAWKLFKHNVADTFSKALKMAWANAKRIAELVAQQTEEVHTWFGWKELGYEVIHESKCLAQVTVYDAKTKSHTRVLSYFGASQVQAIA